MDTERWVPIPVKGYRGLYDISDLGRVRRSAPWPSYRTGQLLTPSRNLHGSLMIRFHDLGRPSNHSLAITQPVFPIVA